MDRTNKIQKNGRLITKLIITRSIFKLEAPDFGLIPYRACDQPGVSLSFFIWPLLRSICASRCVCGGRAYRNRHIYGLQICDIFMPKYGSKFILAYMGSKYVTYLCRNMAYSYFLFFSSNIPQKQGGVYGKRVI